MPSDWRRSIRVASRQTLRPVRGVQDALVERVLGIETSEYRTEVGVHGVHRDSRPYEAMDYVALWWFLRPLALGREDTVVDVGCGLGRVVCVLAQRNVAEVRGIEVDPDLARRARLNADRVRWRRSTVEITCGDAATSDLDGVTAAVLFNPFGHRTTELFLDNLHRSLVRQPRVIRVAYVFPQNEQAFASRSWLRRSGRRSWPAYTRGSYWTTTI